MALDKATFSTYIKQFDFRKLFNEMGWNNDTTIQPIAVNNETYILQAVAEKSGFKILVCQPLSNGLIPDYNTRKKIETQVTKLFYEHLIIFIDAKKTEQVWQLAVRQAGKPTKIIVTRWYQNQEPELLYQRISGIFFELDEEEHITIVDVTKRVAENFQQNNEKVTKQFYEKFKKEHTAFLSFIKGIKDIANKEWYASLMLNRLMFCYFIQKRGFLDNNKNYLRDKLNECKALKGKVTFYSFYRDFLLVLFHKGLNEPPENRPKLNTANHHIELGKIPYLNGGLFDEHELEKNNPNLDIPDQAFERLFNFFDQYEWHLDTRYTASGKDINPDVIGYIFEKYINDRAQMGAYYTKGDITEYISQNCIIPYLFDETKRHYPQAFLPNAEVWQLVKQSGDTYIYDAVKKGINTDALNFNTDLDLDNPDHPLWSDLPAEIRAGFRPDLKDKVVSADDEIHLWQIRKPWNQPAPPTIALPTEIYRELIDRRKRYWQLRKKIDQGEITHINDFITYNLNIRQFAQDLIENTNDPELLKHFYKALNNITILDPTCGSGAFLFAAMNILEPLYEACLQRMENFVAEAHKGKYKFFEETLAQVKSPEHPNQRFFIYKSIILRNLYGVDIMKEAVEIAKLRLFLTLAATVEPDYRKPNLGLEPLPDIDFNIRTGNTLIGYATKQELDNLEGMFITPKMQQQILEECDLVSRAFQRFKELQLKGYNNKTEFIKAKTDLNNRLKKLADNFNKILHKQYYEGTNYEKWLESHKPFHWLAEFYEIINHKGGFDVIIGNPPYVEYVAKKANYQLKNYETEKCGNLYAFVIERSLQIIKGKNNLGMIVPLTIASNNNMQKLRDLISSIGTIYYSHFEIRPAKLFEGVDQRLTIFILRKTNTVKVKSTSIQRWNSEGREILFKSLNYIDSFNSSSIWRLSSNIELSIYDKFQKHKLISENLVTHGTALHYRTAGVRYWIIFSLLGFDSESLSNKKAFFKNKEHASFFMCALNSNLFWWYYSINYDMFNLTDYMIFGFRLNFKSDERLTLLAKKLDKDLLENRTKSVINSVTRGSIKSYVYKKKKSKTIIDEIDTVLAEHYGFTEEELDFIINYDIKYRMGKELEDEE